MVRTTLLAAATLATIAVAMPAAAQTGAPVRTLGRSEMVAGSTLLIAERKALPCVDKTCAARPPKRGYVGAASLGW